MKSIRCKMTCNEMTVRKNWSDKQPYLFSYELAPVCSDDENAENKAFWEATPSGILKIDCSLQKDLFLPGKEYYIDISLVEEAKAIE